MPSGCWNLHEKTFPFPNLLLSRIVLQVPLYWHLINEYQNVCTVSSPLLKQCWLISNWTNIGKKLPWNLNQNMIIVNKKAVENVVCKMSAILFLPEYFDADWTMSIPVNMHTIHAVLCFVVACCRIWSWSPMPCEKHGPRDSVDKNRGRRPRFL